MRLTDWKSDVTSQFGEDGMVAKLNEWLGLKTGTCMEFGAWDGIHFSNTCSLWRDGGWGAVLIESDVDRAGALKQLAQKYSGLVTAVHGRVGLEAGTRPEDHVKDVDLVSIDVDGNDLHIFESTALRPKLFIVEFNPTVPKDLDIYAPYSRDNYFGCGLKSLLRVAEGKGYEYIGSTETNGFFLRGDLKAKLPLDLDVSLDDLPSDKHVTYLVSAYDGKYKATQVGPYGRTVHYDGELVGVA